MQINATFELPITGTFHVTPNVINLDRDRIFNIFMIVARLEFYYKKHGCPTTKHFRRLTELEINLRNQMINYFHCHELKNDNRITDDYYGDRLNEISGMFNEFYKHLERNKPYDYKPIKYKNEKPGSIVKFYNIFNYDL